ncbi:hypothetical protein KB816_003003 [Salmonella enterica]|nr:hypothetical protein [Salmonella enterica]UZV39255.1 tail spike protein [Salmonella phage vB_Hercules_SET]
MTRNVEELFGGVITAPHQIPFTYKSNVGGETFLSLPFYPVTGVVTINGGMQVPLDNFEIDGNTLNLGRALSKGDVVYCLFDKILSPEDASKGIRIYKFQAVGGETEFTPDFTSYGVQSLYIGGEYKTPDIEYSYNSTTGKVSLQTALAAGVWVVVEMSVKQPNISPAFDRSIQEIARSANVKDSEVIVSTDTISLLDGKKVVYDIAAEKIYGIPVIPPNAHIETVANGKLTYNPGSIVVDLLPTPVEAKAQEAKEDVLTELASQNGATAIGYARKPLLTLKTVAELIDDLNYNLVYAVDFGVKVDDSDNADALFALGEYLSSLTVPTKVIFPRGVSLVGSQEFAAASGKGYSYRPAYFQRNWSDLSSAGWFSIHETNANIVLDLRGWTLKINSGMKLGSYDPITGDIAADQISETPNNDYLASHGYLIKIFKAPNVEIIDGTTDGNISGAVWGGKYGNTGYQIPCYNMWINQSPGVTVSKHKFLNSPVDGLYHQSTGDFSYVDIVTKTQILDCYWDSCGRNCYSLTGGANIEIINPVITRSGNKAVGIGSHYSGPEAGIDIEAEGGNPYNIRIVNPKIVNTGKCAFQTVSVPGTVNDIEVHGGVLHSLHSEGAISNAGNARNLRFYGTTIIGGIIDTGSPAAMALDCFTFVDCTMQNRYGNDYVDTYKLNFRVKEFRGNSIIFAIPPTVNVTSATINIQDQDGVSKGLYAERFKENRLTVYGDASKITFANGLGGINFFKNAELFVDSEGLTGGSTKILVDSSSAGFNGLSTNSTNFNFGVTMNQDVGKNIWYAVKETRVAGNILASTDARQQIGSPDGRFSTAYLDLGWIGKDVSVPSNHYRVRINNGVLELVLDNN